MNAFSPTQLFPHSQVVRLFQALGPWSIGLLPAASYPPNNYTVKHLHHLCSKASHSFETFQSLPFPQKEMIASPSFQRQLCVLYIILRKHLEILCYACFTTSLNFLSLEACSMPDSEQVFSWYLIKMREWIRTFLTSAACPRMLFSSPLVPAGTSALAQATESVRWEGQHRKGPFHLTLKVIKLGSLERAFPKTLWTCYIFS